MPGIDVENVSSALDLRKKERNEIGRQGTAVDDAVELLHSFRHPHFPFNAHTQSRHHVTNQECRGQSMPHRIPHGHGEKIIVQHGEIEEISADSSC